MNTFYRLWLFRDYVLSAIITDLRYRYTRSALGGVWAILQPLAQAAIFAVVMSVIMQARLPGMTSTTSYGAYLLSGLLGWNLFVDGVNQGLGLFLRHANTIKKVRFPLLSLPIIAGGITTLNHALLLLATLFILSLLGFAPLAPKVWLMLPVLWLLTLGLGLGLGLMLGIVNVFMRDLEIVVPIVLQLMFWFSAIVYSPSVLPELYQRLLLINPMAGIVQAYHTVLVFDQWPEWFWLAYPAALVVVFFTLAAWLFKRCFVQMVDIL
ncbi:ABC transporter permease [Paenalcaligenes hominis]|uniref:ABC transporter permease n=1 Tax=Paenalcaligenes hominis TaxID=643674 RepID=UPI003523EB90